jgi:hypothetical protein
MRKLFAIFFILIFSASFTEAGQMIKFPILLEHYAKHKKDNNRISFSSFIKIHYLQDHQADGDERQDNELPFKNYTLNTTSGVLYLSTITTMVTGIPGALELRYNVHNSEVVLSDHLFGIFHPPRNV